MSDPAASGILLVDKPQGFTSHDVVSRVRRLAGTRKVGHAGTLDPMATGLLVLGLNSSTRLLTYLVGLDKAYSATIRLGAATNTDDAEGELGRRAAAPELAAIADERIRAGIRLLTGAIQQRPSAVSAIKVDGKRAYKRVREGEVVELPPRPVTVSNFELDEVRRSEWIDLDVRVECSSGTYIRALARDLGESLGVGGHLTALRRTRVGPFEVADAAPLDESLTARLVAPADAAARLFDAVTLTGEQAIDLAHGKRVPLAGEALASAEGSVASGQPVAAITEAGRLIGLVAISGGSARVLVNFPTDEVTT